MPRPKHGRGKDLVNTQPLNLLNEIYPNAAWRRPFGSVQVLCMSPDISLDVWTDGQLARPQAIKDPTFCRSPQAYAETFDA